MRISAHASATHAGRKRRRNEDRFVVRPPLFGVADGMGGAQAGELASRLAAAVLEDDETDGAGPEQRVVALIEEANRRVFDRASGDAAASGMGTTMTVALVDEDRVTIGHVGDSRAYRLRAGVIEQLTDDHSLVAELVRSGKLSPEEADHHPQRSVITRVLGTDPDIDVDVFSVEGHTGDVYMICSDGLTTMVDDERIAAVLVEHGDDLDGAARALVATANRVGGEDNITVVCFALGEDDPTEETQVLDTPTAEQNLAEQDDEDTLSGLDGPAPLGTSTSAEAEREGESAGRSLRSLAFAFAFGLAAVLVLLVLLLSDVF
ncbi:MAG: Stp1/IreP family PP2C-type Ser/Thr phosphatase [Gaiellaceae bacterium]